MKQFKKAYTFDDVCLVPCFNNVESRLDPDVSTWLTKDKRIAYPIINSPMDTVISYELADLISKRGGIPIYNRFSDFDKYKEVFCRYKKEEVSSIIMSTCVNDLDEIKKVIDIGFNNILLDTAHGQTLRMLNTISEVKKYNSAVEIIAGNVCTPEGTRDLINSGAGAIRVGIGNGASCTTRLVTAVGVPQFTAIQECSQEAKRFKVPVICDGSIRNSRDLCLAIAAGATTVMMGKMFALTEESSAEKRVCRIPGGVLMAKYRGQASEDFQKDHYGEVKKGTVAEGIDFWAPVSGSANDMLDTLLAGLRSSMTYLGAKNIKEYQAKARFMEVTSSYMVESKPRSE